MANNRDTFRVGIGCGHNLIAFRLAGGEKIAYYVVSDTVAKLWRAVRA